MQPQDELFDRIAKRRPTMSKGHAKIADYIQEHYDKTAFMTALKFSEKVGLSESTIVRFAVGLGYEGYPELQDALQDLVRNKLTTVQRMEIAIDMDKTALLHSVLKADINNIRMTVDSIDTAAFNQAAEKICNAKRLYIMGLRSAAPMAQFLGYYLNFILDNVHIVTSGINDILEQLVHITPGDVLLGVSFPRYSQRTLDGLRFAKHKGADIIALTDSLQSPLAEYANHLLVAKSDIASFVDSLVAPFSVINALIVSVGLQKKELIAQHFEELEHIWGEYNVYTGKEKGQL